MRQLDFNAASQAMRLSELEERKWSTSPQGQGFRTHARDIPKYIDINSLDVRFPEFHFHFGMPLLFAYYSLIVT